MRYIIVTALLLGLLAGCGTEASSIQYSVIAQENQDQALEAHQRLFDFYGWDGVEALMRVMPDNYAGCFIDEENVLNILTTSATQDTLEAYQKACGTDNIRLKEAAFSFAELEQAMEALAEYNAAHDVPLCYSWGIDEASNCIPIVVSPTMEEAARTLHEEYPCIVYEIEQPELAVWDGSDYEENPDVYLELQLQEQDKLEFKVYNHTDSPIYFGEESVLTVLRDGQWWEIPYRKDAAFVAMLMYIEPGEARDVSEYLNMRAYELTTGTYRLGKPYYSDIASLQSTDGYDKIAYLTFEIS